MLTCVVDVLCISNIFCKWWILGEAWGYEDGNIRECKIHKPVGLLITHDKIYIGESTSSGGGLREVPYTTSQADNTGNFL